MLLPPPFVNPTQVLLGVAIANQHQLLYVVFCGILMMWISILEVMADINLDSCGRFSCVSFFLSRWDECLAILLTLTIPMLKDDHSACATVHVPLCPCHCACATVPVPLCPCHYACATMPVPSCPCHRACAIVPMPLCLRIMLVS